MSSIPPPNGFNDPQGSSTSGSPQPSGIGHGFGNPGTATPPPGTDGGAYQQPYVPPTQAKPMGKATFAAICTGLFLSGCVSGCVSGAALIDSQHKTDPSPTATVTVTAKPSQSPTESESPSATPAPQDSQSTAGTTTPVPEPPAPEAPAPEAPALQGAADPTSLTQTVKHGTITITPFAAKRDDLTGNSALLCTTLTAVNTGKEEWSINPLEFKLSAPDHTRSNITVFGSGHQLNHSELIPGDTVSGDLCFEDSGQRGEYTLMWSPFLSDSVRWTLQIP